MRCRCCGINPYTYLCLSIRLLYHDDVTRMKIRLSFSRRPPALTSHLNCNSYYISYLPVIISSKMPISEHPAATRRPLDSPYPFDNIQPLSSSSTSSPQMNSGKDFSSPSSILTFFLNATRHDHPDSLKEDALELQKRAYDIFPYPCIRSFAFLR